MSHLQNIILIDEEVDQVRLQTKITVACRLRQVTDTQ